MAMNYFKNLLINFLAIFFVSHIILGFELDNISKLPNIGSDLIFSIFLGFLNSLIYLIIFIFKYKLSIFKIFIASFINSFGFCSIVNILPIGIKIMSFPSYMIGSFIIFCFSFFSLYIELCKIKS